jgi:hypothetical protein
VSEHGETDSPLYRVLDIVNATLEFDDLSDTDSRRLTVTQVRDYGGGRFRYCVSDLDDPEYLLSGIYDQEDLRGTGEFTDISRFALPGRLLHREIVVISPDFSEAEVRNLQGEVEDVQLDEGELLATVWIPDLGEVWIIAEKDLVSTGMRVEPPSLNEPRSSQKVSTSGELLGEDRYLVVDRLERYF